MYLQKLHLINFKNYRDAELLFYEGVNCFVGNNGSGKTNLLDAIHYLSLCKSYFNPIDSQNILHNAPFFVIQGVFNRAGKSETVYCSFKQGEKKQFKLNQKEYPRLADHIGLFPVVMIAPIDTNLITEGSDERRRLLDSIISQFDKMYLDDVMNYNKVVSQRNALLKHFAQHHRFDKHALDVWDVQLIDLANKIYEKRKKFIDDFVPVFQKYFEIISSGKEQVGMAYDSQLNHGNITDLLHVAMDKDRALQYSSVGTHKDDLLFTIDKYVVKRFGSQGQQKSFLIAMKLAQFEMLKNIKQVKPILLLDDIFDKLDEVRVSNLMRLVSDDNFGQIFITDAHPERAAEIFKKINVKTKVFEIKDGTIA